MVDKSRRKALKLGGTALAALAATSTVSAHGGETHDTTISPTAREQLAEVRRATAKYQNPEVAKAEGYIPLHHCVPNPDGEGAMGVHYLNPNLRGDGEVTPTEPEVLLYEPTEEGHTLVGVEYIANRSEVDERPELFGQQFVGPMDDHVEDPNDGNEKVDQQHYELHVWCWRTNPKGMFAPFNPNVSCK